MSPTLPSRVRRLARRRGLPRGEFRAPTTALEAFEVEVNDGRDVEGEELGDEESAAETEAKELAPEGPGPAADRAAWTALARALFNLDEAVTRG